MFIDERRRLLGVSSGHISVLFLLNFYSFCTFSQHYHQHQTGVSQIDNTSADILSSNSPKKSIPSIITTHSPMSSGVGGGGGGGDSMKTSTRSVSIETGTRNRSPMQTILVKQRQAIVY